MKYDLDSYRFASYPIIEDWCKTRTIPEAIKASGEVAHSSACPMVVIAYYMTEIYGTSVGFEAFIKSMETYYKVTEVKGKRRVA